MKKRMTLFVGILLLIMIVIWVVMSKQTADTSNDAQTRQDKSEFLPWHVTTNSDESTRVLGVDVGTTTFKELMLKLHILAEPALFESAEGELSLETFFGKKKFGMLEARLVAELDAEKPVLEKMLREATDKKSTPSNHWKYALNVENTRIANDLRVWRLVYLPVADYAEKQIGFFGKPEEVIKVNETASYLLFPTRGLVVLWDTAGKEIFYYVAKKDFERLRRSLPMKALIDVN